MSSPELGYDRLYWSNIREYEMQTGGSVWAGFSDARLKLAPMLGYVYRSERGIEALGGVFWFDRRRPEGQFVARLDFAVQKRRSMWVHRAALEVIELAHRHSPVIYARADLTVPRSIEWLERLGFAPPDYPGEWWTHGVHTADGCGSRIVLNEHGGHGGSDRRVDRDDGLRPVSAGCCGT